MRTTESVAENTAEMLGAVVVATAIVVAVGLLGLCATVLACFEHMKTVFSP